MEGRPNILARGSFLGGEWTVLFCFCSFFFGTAGTPATTANAHGFQARFGSGSVWAWAWLGFWSGLGVGLGSARCLSFFFLPFDATGFVCWAGSVVKLLSARESVCGEGGERGWVCVWMVLWDYLCSYAMLC